MTTMKVIKYKRQGSSNFIFLINAILLIFIVFSLLFAANINAASVSLAWDANSESDLAGYKIYASLTSGSYISSNSVDVGNVTSYTVTGLQASTTYYFVATAYDTDGYESDYSDEVNKTTAADPAPAASSGSSGCFIATAAFGSNMKDEVMVLKKFRDDCLLKTFVGRKFVTFYYKISPPVADIIREHETLKTTTRFALTPIVLGIKYPKTLCLFIFGLAILPFIKIRNKVQG